MRPSGRPTASSSASSSIPRSCTRSRETRSSRTSSSTSAAPSGSGAWRASSTRPSASCRQTPEGRVLCAVSGGVDSSVASVLLNRAIARQAAVRLHRHRPPEGGGSGRGLQVPQGRPRRPARVRRRLEEVPRRAEGRLRPRGEAEDNRAGLRRDLRGVRRRTRARSGTSRRAPSTQT